MALSYSSVTVDDVTSISTTEKKISSETNPGSNGIQVDPNEILILSVSIGAHANDDITVTAYGRLGTSGGWYELKAFDVLAGDTDEHEIGVFMGVEYVDVGYVASGSTDTPTASTLAKTGPMNGA